MTKRNENSGRAEYSKQINTWPSYLRFLEKQHHSISDRMQCICQAFESPCSRGMLPYSHVKDDSELKAYAPAIVFPWW